MKLVSAQFLLIIATPLILAHCGQGVSESEVNEAINVKNDPRNIPLAGEFDYNAMSLVTSGKTRPIWTGDYWPMSQGGTARRPSINELSPMEKYDLVAETGGRAFQWEVENSRHHSNVSWSGHCNGLAAAGIRTKEPIKSVNYKGVDFSPTDIKALLVESFQNTGSLVGERCNIAFPERDSSGRIIDRHIACRDLNPATLHLALTNFIGLHAAPIILDVSYGEEVWNYPVIEYNFTQEEVTKDAAIKRLRLSNSSYIFNEDARKFLEVKMAITLVNGNIRTYKYILEVDDFYKIIGGEWIEESQENHPDFVWSTGSRANPENPFLKTDIVFEIYKSSY